MQALLRTVSEVNSAARVKGRLHTGIKSVATQEFLRAPERERVRLSFTNTR